MRKSLFTLMTIIVLEKIIHGQPSIENPMLDGVNVEISVPPEQGERYQQATFSSWLSDPNKPVKAVIIHQHGCTNASPESHPPVTCDSHWRAIAKKHDCLLLVPMYQVEGDCSNWNDPESGSERALFAVLADLSKRYGRPEINDLPWILWGHSGGSSWSAQMIVRHPKRVLAASFRGGCSKQFGVPEFRARFGLVARDLPLLFVWGKRESVPTSKHFVSWEPMKTMYADLRTQCGKVCRIIDPRSEHGCDDSRLISIPFFDAVLSGAGTPGVLADIEALEPREMNPTNLAKPTLTWLPNEHMMTLWKEFSTFGNLKSKQPKLQAPAITALRQSSGSIQLTWQIEPALDGGLRAVRIYRDEKLWKQLGAKPEAFIATSRDSAPEGLRKQGMVDESQDAHTYSVTFLDSAGNESPHSQMARVP